MLYWLQIGSVGFILVDHQLPADTQIVEARVIDQCWIELTLHSSAFPALSEYADVPAVMAPTFRGRPAQYRGLLTTSAN
jgi:hypothetical protein